MLLELDSPRRRLIFGVFRIGVVVFDGIAVPLEEEIFSLGLLEEDVPLFVATEAKTEVRLEKHP